MPLDENQADKLAALVEALRPGWQAAGVKAQLGKVAGRNPFDVAHAVLRAAEDPGAITPGVIATPGPHWSESRAVVAPRGPLPHEECARHPGQYRLSCSGCRADTLAHPDDEQPAEPLTAEQARELCRQAAAAARRKETTNDD